ncbi:MAG: class I SAM-dependent methyltransferase [Myxococcales bacterium]|nr:class I SAM-dependent methyltransferase [Myxococcales bacterium]MCB9642980.1 class I SAM-dependent methyltransferase [Myxococcales bacterium]
MEQEHTQSPTSQEEWETQVALLLKKKEHLRPEVLSYHLQRALHYLPWLLQQSEKRVWFAGYGLSLAPLLFASYGCSVWATEISPSAVRMLARLQTPRWTRLVPQLTALLKASDLPPPPHPPLMLYPQHQDFCLQAPEEEFDLLLNFRAFQCLSSNQQREAAQIFFDALRLGGLAIFEAHNLSPTERLQLENLLEDIGFVMPFNQAERWYQEERQKIGEAVSIFRGMTFSTEETYPQDAEQERSLKLREDYTKRIREAQKSTSGTQRRARFARVIYLREV